MIRMRILVVRFCSISNDLKRKRFIRELPADEIFRLGEKARNRFDPGTELFDSIHEETSSRSSVCFSAKNFQSHRAGIYPREKSAFTRKFVRNGAPSCGVSRPMHSKSLDTCCQAAPKTAVLYLLSGNRGPGQRRRGWKRR